MSSNTESVLNVTPKSSNRWLWFHKLSSPPYAYRTSGVLQPWLLWSALALMAIGLYGGLLLAPADYQQKDSFRIMYVHVPSASMSLMVYVVMAIASAVGLIWRMKLAHALAAACAAVGAWFSVLTLVTGALWGKPMWGTWWTWDPRLTSELVQLFLYLGFIALRSSFEDTQRADRACAILAIVGVINVPIVKYSVVWWNSLHQGPSIKLTGSTIDSSMLWPLFVMLLAFALYFAAVMCDRLRVEILKRERNASWLADLGSKIMSEFFDMGGYGAYIWPCYALALIVLVGIAVSARHSLAVEQVRALRRVQANQESQP